jgi:hypothetical protein
MAAIDVGLVQVSDRIISVSGIFHLHQGESPRLPIEVTDKVYVIYLPVRNKYGMQIGFACARWQIANIDIFHNNPAVPLLRALVCADLSWL